AGDTAGRRRAVRGHARRGHRHAAAASGACTIPFGGVWRGGTALPRAGVPHLASRTSQPLSLEAELKITAIETVVVNAVLRNWIFVKVLTDQPGLYGWGEATLEWKTRAVTATIEDLAPFVIGEDPQRIEHIVRRMTHFSFWPLGVIGLTAVSGIEQALWDIKGKSLGVPVWQLLGGRVRDHV